MREDLYDDFFAVETRHWWFCARRLIIESLLRRHLGSAGASRIADVGCGTGANLAMLHRVGQPVGLDGSWNALKFSHARGEPNLVAGILPTLPCQSGSFDVVCALDVIEHVTDDDSAVQELVRICKPGGLLVITVPAYQWLWSEHDVVNEHKRRYTRSTLAARLQLPQLEVLQLTYINSLLAPPLMAYRLVRNVLDRFQKKPQATADLFLPRPAVNRLLNWVFSLEQHWLKRGNFPFGISVLCTLRKREV